MDSPTISGCSLRINSALCALASAGIRGLAGRTASRTAKRSPRSVKLAPNGAPRRSLPCTPRHIYEPDYAQNHRSACDLSDFVRIRRSPPVQVVLFQFFLFRGARLLLPRGPRTRCTGARRLTTIETEKTKFRPCKISGLLLTRELALCALTTSAGFTESVWSITCMRNQQRASLTHYWLF